MRKIREIRKLKGDTLKELAAKVQYDFSNLSKIERGQVKPSLKLLSKIADIYGVNISYFLEEEQLSKAEQSFIGDLELSSSELMNKYRIILDGKQVTTQEADFIVSMIRKLRETINDVNEKQ
ncbi:helix-turn-helix domain-containing protein [Fictibacillus norfolkensis]|uniref:Helix-turn-helix transcriptional regulator n=1 Tax=Fictibacillus norfolkensis TaxID=2762233 RepID=A0ABR8SJ50_9BACL|nr:helix-turn-helix transcriptional regulator [Fictibacillus norfolkensis]MBD7963518.1 helix-turn-helix transcriptional regulator [Fictibacillus norfolkensis]